MFPKNIQIIVTFINLALLVLTKPNNVEISSNDASNSNVLPDGLSFVEFTEEYKMISYGETYFGAVDDKSFIDINLKTSPFNVTDDITIKSKEMTGSSFLVSNKENNGYYFARNYNSKKDSNNLIVVTHPFYFFSSISTVNTDFIQQLSNSEVELSDDILKFVSIFAPLDGMNEKGVSISLQMNENTPNNNGTIDQNFLGLINVTPTSLVRTVLDIASSADEAVDLVRTLNLHNTFNYNIHYQVADSTGKSYVIEYVNNEMVITKSSIVTNSYITEKESHSASDSTQFNIIKNETTKTPNMSIEEVKDTLSDAKDNTQWSVIYDLINKEAIYYSKENYEQEYRVKLNFTPKPEPSVPLEIEEKDFKTVEVNVTEKIQEFEENVQIVEFKGDDGLDASLEKEGGFDNEINLLNYVANYKGYNITDVLTNISEIGCSTFLVQNEKGDGYYFGRNFDFSQRSNVLILVNRPSNGYVSISTVNKDFIQFSRKDVDDEILKLIAVYMPLDGSNEKGLSISANMVPGNFEIHQNVSGKDSITIVAAIRLMLNKAATVDEAIELLKKYNMHFINHLIIHFIITDASGKAVVVEYYENEIYIIDTPVVTNYYFNEDLKKYNVDIMNGDNRYKTILKRVTEKPNQSLKDVRNTLRLGNQGDMTQWSVAYDKKNSEATYFFKNNYDVGYHIKLLDDSNGSTEHLEEESTVTASLEDGNESSEEVEVNPPTEEIIAISDEESDDDDKTLN